MSTPFLGEMRTFSFAFAPNRWALANGQTLPINQNQALFSLLGTTYGGDGVQTFKLPNLQGAVPIGWRDGTNSLGQIGGEESHTLTVGEMASHNHPLVGSPATATTNSPVNNVLATGSGADPYGPAPGNTTMATTELGTTGGGQPHENHQPYLVLSVCISLVGIFPSRN
jgi:microcystin-dependent protein